MAYWGRYVSVAERRAKALKEVDKLRKKGVRIQPVQISGRALARSFWGKGWCEHLESFSDYSNRLPRGRTYARNGSVCHLEIKDGLVKAMVSGSSLYQIEVKIMPLADTTWKDVKKLCGGQIGSMLELLQGKLSKEVMSVVSDRRHGLFPQPREIQLSCSCPDWATMCKHVAAVLYGVGNRLDDEPELLFLLRGVNPEELISAELSFADGVGEELPDEQLETIFGIDLDFEFVQEQSTEVDNFETGDAVATLRKRLGLSVREFAVRLGYTPATVYRWESSPKLNLRQSAREALERLARKRA
ncbi:MAG: helix-turn-helix domain-containing protein [Vulcanimicrobiota bacterium]